MGIHNYEKGYQAARNRVLKATIPEKSKDLILAMNEDLVLDGLSKPRLMKYLEVLKKVAEKVPVALDEATEEHLKKVVAEIQRSNFSPWTKQTYKVIIRRFYKWLHKSNDYPEIVKWISIRMSRSEKKLPSEGDLLNEKDVEKLLSSTDHPRDKAFVSMLWESGCRISEIGNLQMKHIVFDKYGTVITVHGKTGSRKIRLIASTPHIATWLNTHPLKKGNVWVNVGPKWHNKPMSYSNMGQLLKRLFAKAGIDKRCNPHIFRHSRATFMAHHLTEFQMNQYFGWIQGSDMPSTYVHMSGKNVDNAILKMNGFAMDEEEEPVKPVRCVRCETINSYESKFCLKCGGVLDMQEALNIQQAFDERKDADGLMDKLLQDKDVQALLMSKLRGIDQNI